jgi:hypothetical protein
VSPQHRALALRPLAEIVRVLFLAVGITGLIALGQPLFLAFGILQEATLPALDIFVVDAQLLHLGHGVVIELVHFRSPSISDEKVKA